MAVGPSKHYCMAYAGKPAGNTTCQWLNCLRGGCKQCANKCTCQVFLYHVDTRACNDSQATRGYLTFLHLGDRTSVVHE
jgi:hypothetical protein